MDNAASDTSEHRSRPQRSHRLPAYLEDYQVGSHPPMHSAPPVVVSRSASHYSNKSSTSSNKSSYIHSRSSRRTSYSAGTYPTQGLSTAQAAILEERIKQLELEDVRRLITQETQADLECKRLDEQAKEAQRLQEEALKAREALTKQLERQQRLARAEQDLEIAKLRSSLLSHGQSPSPAPSAKSNHFMDLPLLVQSTQVNPMISAFQSPLSTQLPLPSASVVHSQPPQLTQRVIPASTVTSTGPQPMLQPDAIPAIFTSSANPTTSVISSTLLAHPTPQVAPCTKSNPPSSPGPVPISYFNQTSANPGVPQSSAEHQPAYYCNQPKVEPLNTPQHVGQRAPPLSSMHHGQQMDPVLPAPYSGYTSLPGAELLLATTLGIPRPSLPVFESGRESDFALLKLALDNVLGNHLHLSEQYKYQVLLGHIKLPSALQLAKAFMHDPTPYTNALQALQDKYGQPRQLVQSELGAILNTPVLKMGDANAFDSFALSVQSLVGMLRSLEGQNGYELHCGSHVDRLLSKMPPTYRDGFIEYCLRQGILQTGTDRTYTLPDLATWLQMKSQVRRISSRAAALYHDDTSRQPRRDQQTARPKEKPVTMYFSATEKMSPGESTASGFTPAKAKSKTKPFCPYCNNYDHYLNSCEDFKKLNTEQILKWLKDDKRCWKCGRNHPVDRCTLKRPCKTCKENHLTVLRESVQETKRKVYTLSLPPTKVYLDRPNRSQRVMLKVVKVLLYNGNQRMETYAVLDDGSERSIVLPQVVHQLNLVCHPEILPLQTVHQSVTELKGASVSLEVSSLLRPSEKYLIPHAFTAEELALAEHTYPVAMLQRKYKHLRDLPLPSVNGVQPLLLIGADMPHLITPIQPVYAGQPGGPVAICTQLGWSLQGPVDTAPISPGVQQCLHIATTSASSELLANVERLWKIDTLPYSEKVATRSKEDHQALTLLQRVTTRVTVDGIQRYTTPLLRRTTNSSLRAPVEAVLPRLRSLERKLAKDPTQAKAYCSEIQRLEEAGYISKILPEDANQSSESWFIPHHIVHHNGKNRVVFDCSFQYKGQSLNELLLPGPTLGPSLLGVLLRFRQHSVAVSSDIKAMFHQIRLQPADRPVLRFIWREMEREDRPIIYEWQVLPFGTTCSPCCATYALQHHVRDNCGDKSHLTEIVENSYVDNCLHSTRTTAEAKALIDNLRQLLLEGGFDLRQWASNVPAVIEHLPPEAKSEHFKQSLSKGSSDLLEPTLGLQWNCLSDTLCFKLRPADHLEPTMRNIYKALASQYDPLGFIIPFTTRAKVLIQDIWKQNIGWDDPIEPESLREQWTVWVKELPEISHLEFPRTYAPPCADKATTTRELHIFCDASERAYGSVAYMRTVDDQDHVHTSFVMARSRVAPKRVLSMPRLELSAALTGAQLAKLIHTELTIPIQQTFLWSDSTTVLQWLRSESCRYKVFVGTRVAEIQTLTDVSSWRYVESARNPADDITRGLRLSDLTHPHRWISGPDFLHQPPDQWPTLATAAEVELDATELKKSTLIFLASAAKNRDIPDPTQFQTWKDLVQATVTSLHGAAASGEDQTVDANTYISVEKALLARAQEDSFPDELKAVKASRPIPADSRLVTLSPEYDKITGLLRIGGRLRQATDLEGDALHPIILDPAHQITKLLIQDFDHRLLHPGPERVLAEMRRQYWVLRGREAIRGHQRTCRDCQFWRAKPDVPKMADLPPSRLRMYKPPFYSTGVDCFGPFSVKIGRRTEKRWGILYKCLTTRCVHLDLLESLDKDAFLLSLRRFIARRGTPFELLCDNGTNFVGGERELREAFHVKEPELQEQLAKQKISFQFNPPSAPHFGGAWEREVRSVKTALRVILKEQSVPEPVLATVFSEVEGILNAKPLGYVSADASDPDPITPHLLLMGRHDSSLPQALYDSSSILGTRRWRHSQVLVDNFWSTFIRHYLPSLQGRSKWQAEGHQLSVDQVVLIVDPQLPRALWPVGKVVDVYPGVDGRIRTASVKVKDKTYVRPVARLIRLPKISDSEDNVS